MQNIFISIAQAHLIGFHYFLKFLETSEILIKEKANLENRFLNNYFWIHVDIAAKLRKHLTVIWK